ncbi:MAG TPA: carbamoyltransferase HypF [Rhizomicrobium sp.]|jgi:hydrogenase maturation protein HypF|nr:carbamoyltransferase HypF [Rhizomicrobium sp.]
MSGAYEIRVRGRVQGVGFRPAVWRHARALALDGEVLNDGEGVLMRVAGGPGSAGALIEALRREPPPLAEIDTVETREWNAPLAPGFFIVESRQDATNTQVTPDALLCADCRAEITDPANRRFGYAFTNCTHCGPRLSIVRAIPYDRANTTMSAFPLCADCGAEYEDPADRRFHAEPIACPVCGPKLSHSLNGIARLLKDGEVVAIKGLGGYQLACDATNGDAVASLRQGKKRDGKPFALMMTDLAMVRRYCRVSEDEAQILQSAAAPIVLLEKVDNTLPEAIAPGLNSLGAMLPTTPLHALLMAQLDVPLVMTSGNLTGEPQITDDAEAVAQLGAITSHILTHDREIANRVDDSVVRFMAGAPRLIRRARGYAPAPVKLPKGFEDAPDLLALGGELKAAFCVVKDGQAILSQHQGDLEQAPAFADFRKNLLLYEKLFDHAPLAVAADKHPEYLSTKLGRAIGLPVVAIQHHHAHIASCLAENGWPRDGGKVIGIALDGLGWGDDGTIWGGEFLLADYCGFERLAWLKPVAMPGGTQAIREPWRNLFAHLDNAFGEVTPLGPLQGKPLTTIAAMIRSGTNAPKASSCGRLFDAVAAALGLCDGVQAYEGEAASRLEALAEHAIPETGYPFDVRNRALDPAPMWAALLGDLATGVHRARIAARFHVGLAFALAKLASELAQVHGVNTLAFSGGCFQNRFLFEQMLRLLEQSGLHVLTHSRVPANDGGLALGQALVAAAQILEGAMPCA